MGTMQDVDRHGIGKVMDMVLERIDSKGERPIHLSYDIDGSDPSVAPGTGTLARGGLSFRESHYVCESLAQTGRLGSMDMVEVNIDLDDPPKKSAMHGDDPNIGGTPTVAFGMELISSDFVGSARVHSAVCVASPEVSDHACTVQFLLCLSLVCTSLLLIFVFLFRSLEVTQDVLCISA